MTTVKAFIRTGKKDKEVNIRFRLSDGRDVQLFHKSEFMVLPILWDAKNEQYKAKSVIKLEQRTLFNSSINERKSLILSIYQMEMFVYQIFKFLACQRFISTVYRQDEAFPFIDRGIE